jgi:peptide/nickel transport system substrate-binding protein
MKNKKMSKVLLVALFVIPLIAINGTTNVSAALTSDTIIYGTGRLQNYIEPTHVWDSASYNVLDQIAEPLFGYDLTDPDLPLVPILATSLGVWSNNDLTLTIPLKEGVTFHNGDEFNATTVHWNFMRLITFVEQEIGVSTELYRPIEWEPVLNSCEIIGDYEIALHLNYKLAFFRDLVSFAACYQIAPTFSNPVYNDTRFAATELETGVDSIIGTGPFTYGTFTSGESMIMPAYADYHGTPAAYTTLIFQEFSDDDTRNVAFLASEYHINAGPNPEYLADIDASPDHVLFDGPDSASVTYLGLNTEAIPLYWRKIISYSFNYTYYIDEILEGWGTRLKSCIPTGIKYSNYSNDVAMQKTKTEIRQMLVDDGHTAGNTYEEDLADVSDNAAWKSALKSDPIAEFNYTYNTDNNVRRDAGVMLQQYLGDLGITMNLIGITWDDYVSRLYGIRGHSHSELGIYLIGWIPDYNDPSNFVNPFWTPGTSGNTEQVNDTQLTEWMIAGLTETDEAARQQIYNDIQKRVVEVIVPWVFVSVSSNPDAWVIGVEGWPSNPFGRTYLKDVTYTPPAAPATPAIPGFPLAVFLVVLGSSVALVMYRIKKRD